MAISAFLPLNKLSIMLSHRKFANQELFDFSKSCKATVENFKPGMGKSQTRWAKVANPVGESLKPGRRKSVTQ